MGSGSSCIRAAEAASWPANVPVTQGGFDSWDGAKHVDGVTFAQPTSVEQCVAVANWAARHGVALRVMGKRTAWSPMGMDEASGDSPRLVVVQTEGIARVREVNVAEDWVEVEAGCTLGDLLEELDRHDRALSQFPAYGSMTIGGCVSMGARGWAGAGTKNAVPGTVPGTMANTVLEVTCVVSNASGVYEARTFSRRDPEGRALIVSLGRAFIVSLKLRTTKQFLLRIQSLFQYDFNTVYGPPRSDGTVDPLSFQGFYERGGRLSVLWWGSTSLVWTRWGTFLPAAPAEGDKDAGRQITQPCAYVFQNSGNPWQTDLMRNCIGIPNARSILENVAWWVERPFTKGNTGPLVRTVRRLAGAAEQLEHRLGLRDVEHRLTGGLNRMIAMYQRSGNAFFNTKNLWGKSHHMLIYVADGFLVASHGLTILCNSKRIQNVVYAAAGIFRNILNDMQSQGKYPMNMPLEFRAGGLDDPSFAGTEGSLPLSYLYTGEKAKANGWDAAVFIDNVYLLGTPHLAEWMQRLWQQLNAHPALSGSNGEVLFEWAKAFASDGEKLWACEATMQQQRERLPEWDSAMSVLEKYDQKRLYTNPLLDKLTKKRVGGEVVAGTA